VIGPGSVTLMSTTGANYQYSLLWLSLVAGALMAGFIALFMRFGVLCEDTFLGLTARKLGRWFAVLCGVTIFLVSAAFQFGNALGVTAGMEAVFADVADVPQYIWPVAFTTAAILFLFGFKRIYFVLEKMMTFFLVFMVVAFLGNLVWAIWVRPNPSEVLSGIARGACVPTLPEDVNWVYISGLVGTTFCITAAFFQSYLVKAKGWTDKDLASGVSDTVTASVMLTLIGAMIMMTAATVLYPHQGGVTFEVMIGSLKEVFGPSAKIIFSVGFWAAAFSSFVANSVTGGVMLSDGLGLAGKIDSTSTKVFASCVLLIGMTTGIFIIYQEQVRDAEAAAVAAQSTPQNDTAAAPKAEPAKKLDLKVAAILVGQAATMLAVPLGAIAMVVVLFDRRATKGRALPIWAKGFVLLGSVVLLGIAALTYWKIKPALMTILGMD
jgi:manganese transport protein